MGTIIYWMPFGIYTRRGDGMTATVLLQRFHDDMLSKMRIFAQRPYPGKLVSDK